MDSLDSSKTTCNSTEVFESQLANSRISTSSSVTSGWFFPVSWVPLLLSIWTFELPINSTRIYLTLHAWRCKVCTRSTIWQPPIMQAAFSLWTECGPWNWSPLCGIIVPKRRPVRKLINSGTPVNGLQDTHVCAQANLRKIQSLPGGILMYLPFMISETQPSGHLMRP